MTTTHTTEISAVHQLALKLEACSSKLISAPHESQGEETGMEVVIPARKTETKTKGDREDGSGCWRGRRAEQSGGDHPTGAASLHCRWVTFVQVFWASLTNSKAYKQL